MISLQKKAGEGFQCLLCPHQCVLKSGKAGICGVRKNTGESIELMTYGILSGYSLDPVEKKPLYHFFPGQNILSIGSYGCNMKCDFCQNYNISQTIPENSPVVITPAKIIKNASSYKNNIGIAFTYNEPVIWFEFVMDIANSAKMAGLSTVMVSNGFINSQPLDEYINVIDAFNIDLKAFNNKFYSKLSKADIEPVKRGLKQISKSGKHLEITTLIIPGQNDDHAEMSSQSEWIAGELGRDVPLHLSRYFPMYKRDDPATSHDTMKRLFEVALKNLDYVYMGNTTSDTGQSTQCPQCGTEVTKRTGYKIRIQNIDSEGKCTSCGKLVYKYFISS